MNDKWYSLEKNIDTPQATPTYDHHSQNYDKIHFSQRLYNIFQDTRFTFTNPVLQSQVPKKVNPESEIVVASDSKDDSHPNQYQFFVDKITKITDCLNDLNDRITLLEGPWYDLDGNLDFDTQVSAMRISLIPTISSSVHKLMKGVIEDGEDSDCGENERKKQKISHRKNSTTMSCVGMNHFKRPSNDKNMVTCPMVDIQCHFSKFKDKAGKGLFDEGFDTSHIGCFDKKTCKTPKNCCHT